MPHHVRPKRRHRPTPESPPLTPALRRAQAARIQGLWQEARQSVEEVAQLLRSTDGVTYALLAIGPESHQTAVRLGQSPTAVMELLRRIELGDLDGDRPGRGWRESSQSSSRLPEIYDWIPRLASTPCLRFGLVWSVAESNTFDVYTGGMTWDYFRAEVTYWVVNRLWEELDSFHSAVCPSCGAERVCAYCGLCGAC